MEAVRGVRIAVFERVQHHDRQAVLVAERDGGVERRVFLGAEGLHEPAQHVVAAVGDDGAVREAARAEAEGVERGHVRRVQASASKRGAGRGLGSGFGLAAFGAFDFQVRALGWRREPWRW